MTDCTTPKVRSDRMSLVSPSPCPSCPRIPFKRKQPKGQWRIFDRKGRSVLPRRVATERESPVFFTSGKSLRLQVRTSASPGDLGATWNPMTPLESKRQAQCFGNKDPHDPPETFLYDDLLASSVVAGSRLTSCLV